VHEGQRDHENAELEELRGALRGALGDEFVALVDSHPELIEQHPAHLWALVEIDDPVERMRHARAYVAQLEGPAHASPGQRTYQIRGMRSPAEAYAARDTAQPEPGRPSRAESDSGARPISADERASAQLRLRVEGWLGEVERVLRRIDASTLDRLQAEDRQVVEDQIDRVRARLAFLVVGRPYPD
jgi:hypothetical protein